MSKERLDVLLVERGLVGSRERAKTSIMAGLVLVDGQKVDKAGTLVTKEAEIVVQGDSIGYVSRGGLKLARALQYFHILLDGLVMADIGASTGGFTDCALRHGAIRVYAIDVGYGQLAWSLRNDPRVVNLERTNVRYITLEQIGELLDFISIDVAFISLKKVFPAVKTLLRTEGTVVALIKPQFEAGRENVGKKGVVRDPGIHRNVIRTVIDSAMEIGFTLLDLTYSPVKGPEGNIEYLLYLSNNQEQLPVDLVRLIEQVVSDAHGMLP